MSIGLSTYAFFWQWHATADRPRSLIELIDKTADWAVDLFQICDYPAIESFTDDQLDQLADHARARGVDLELGTRGVTPDQLGRYLEIAQRLGVTLVRSMFNRVEHEPTEDEAVELLKQIVPAYEQAGVTIALETYEQVPVQTLINTVERVDSDRLGICLDPANCVAALEHPIATIDRTAPYVRNLHVKDFGFSRKDGWVGFTLAGTPLGEGLLDYDHLIETVRPDERGISKIIEHWLPWQGDSATTIAIEDQWTLHNLSYLRSKES